MPQLDVLAQSDLRQESHARLPAVLINPRAVLPSRKPDVISKLMPEGIHLLNFRATTHALIEAQMRIDAKFCESQEYLNKMQEMMKK